MPRVEERVIGGRTFKVHQLPFGQSRDLLVLLGQILGPGLSGIAAGGAGGDGLEGLGGFGAIAGGIGGMLERLNPAQLDRIQGVFAAKTFVEMPDGKRPLLSDAGFEAVFGENIEDYFLWLGFAIEVNYARFFGALKSAFVAWAERRKAARAAVETGTQSGSSSPPASTGMPTG